MRPKHWMLPNVPSSGPSGRDIIEAEDTTDPTLLTRNQEVLNGMQAQIVKEIARDQARALWEDSTVAQKLKDRIRTDVLTAETSCQK